VISGLIFFFNLIKKLNLLPLPGDDSTKIFPPIISTRFLQIDNPSPEPRHGDGADVLT
jgi:hypothetical protein